MTTPYYYLKKFKPAGAGINDNWFVPVSQQEILEAEKKLGFQFPDQLKEFYLEIGTGCLRSPEKPSADYNFYGYNEIMRPSEIADIMLLGHESGLISEEALECMEPGDLPFFHISDSSSFLVMRPQSDNPNAVYTDTGILIENEFNRFVWRLYYENPSYYEDIIEAHYEAH